MSLLWPKTLWKESAPRFTSYLLSTAAAWDKHTWACCRTPPQVHTHTPEPAAGPPHRYTHAHVSLWQCIWCEYPVVVCVQMRVRPLRSPGWSTVTQCVSRCRLLLFLESSCTLRTTLHVCASGERWSKSTEDTSANWSVLTAVIWLLTGTQSWWQNSGSRFTPDIHVIVSDHLLSDVTSCSVWNKPVHH